MALKLAKLNRGRVDRLKALFIGRLSNGQPVVHVNITTTRVGKGDLKAWEKAGLILFREAYQCREMWGVPGWYILPTPEGRAWLNAAAGVVPVDLYTMVGCWDSGIETNGVP